jgi:hypothetical protein
MVAGGREPLPVGVSLGVGGLADDSDVSVGSEGSEGREGSEGGASSDVLVAAPADVVADATVPGSLPRNRKNRPAPTAARTTTAATTRAIIVFLFFVGGWP